MKADECRAGRVHLSRCEKRCPAFLRKKKPEMRKVAFFDKFLSSCSESKKKSKRLSRIFFALFLHVRYKFELNISPSGPPT